MSFSEPSLICTPKRTFLYICLGIGTLWIIWPFIHSTAAESDRYHVTSYTHRPYPPSLLKVQETEPHEPSLLAQTIDYVGAAGHGPSSEEELECRQAPGGQDVMIALKTGSGEVYSKVPGHLLTLLKCVPSYGIFSDVAQTIGDVRIYDAFSVLDESWRSRHTEFDYYNLLQSYREDGQNIARLQGEEKEGGDDRKGWKLDKWKTLATMRSAYNLFPDKKWYLIIDGDTAVNWSNLLLWLQQLNSEEPVYAGSQISLMGITFAHGGSGILVSRAAMLRWIAAYDNEVQLREWENDLANSCCGDAMLAKQMLDIGIPMTPAFPLIQGETPLTIDWNERHMCTPAVTWHHVLPSEIEMLWEKQVNWTETHGWHTPYLFRDIFAEYVERLVRERRDEWDNITADQVYREPLNDQDQEWSALTDVQRASVLSFENCREACLGRAECKQFKYRDRTCSLGDVIRIGTLKQGEAVTSGWLVDRVEEYGSRFRHCEANWAFNQ